jgi:CMP-N-acetylneuraminic acid synthetase
MLIRNNFDSVISVVKVRQHPNWMFRMDERKRITPIHSRMNTRRQLNEDLFYPNGAVFASTTEFINKQEDLAYGGRCGGYIMDESRSIDIDTAYDWQLCQHLLNQTTDSLEFR